MRMGSIIERREPAPGAHGLKAALQTWVTYHNVVLLNLFGVFVGIVLIVAGLSSATVYCEGEGQENLYLIRSFKQEYYTYAMTRLQNAGQFTCGTYWQFQWAIWSLQVVWFAAFIAVYALRCLPQYLHGLNSVATTCIVWHIWNANDLLVLKPTMTDPLYTYGVVSFLGVMACIICDFAILFCAGALAHEQQRLETHGRAASDSTISKGDNGSKMEMA